MEACQRDRLNILPTLLSNMAGAQKGLYTGSPKKKKSTGKLQITKKADVPKTTVALLKETHASSRAEFGRPKRTRDNYARYVARGRDFLADLVKERRKDSAGDDDGVDTDLLEKAFDNPPNKYSVLALEWFLTQKCFTEGLGKSTGAGIQGAFADLWDNM